MRQSVLIISNCDADRETLPLLLGSMGCRCTVASTLEDAVGILNRESAAAVIADSRLAIVDSVEKNQTLGDILARLPGRIVLLLNEPDDLAAIEFARAYSLPFIRRDRWAQDLWGSLETLLRRPSVTQRIKETARLAFDAFKQPLPAGIRFSQLSSRHLLYETNFLTIDLSFELLPDSNRLSLGGQILTNAYPKHALNGAPVRVRGRERPLGFALTNQSGEFTFQFEREPNVVVEIEDAPNHCVTLYSPNPIWPRQDRPQNGQARENGQRSHTREKRHSPKGHH